MMGVTSGSSLFTAAYFFGVTIYFKTFWKPCVWIILLVKWLLISKFVYCFGLSFSSKVYQWGVNPHYRGLAWSRDSGTHLKIFNILTLLLLLTSISLKTMLPLPGFKQPHVKNNFCSNLMIYKKLWISLA